MYRNDLDDDGHEPVKGLRVLLVLSVLSIIVFSATLFYKFNMFILLREEVYAKSGNVEASIQRRQNLFENLVNLTLNHAMLEHDIFRTTSKQRAEMARNANSDSSQESLRALQSKSEEMLGKLPPSMSRLFGELIQGGTGVGAMGRLMAVVEQYPNIQTSKTYHTLMAQLVEIETMITSRRAEYHMALRDYNIAISKFPWYLIADITNFRRIEYYKVDTETHPAPIIDSKMYKQLTPMDENYSQYSSPHALPMVAPEVETPALMQQPAATVE
ncbi:MAG: LemA family protein [Zetaproteobacteria bacterium]|nr:LemA family protein [Zetaproteobacteria bacterium]